jgi:hypothetical protein
LPALRFPDNLIPTVKRLSSKPDESFEFQAELAAGRQDKLIYSPSTCFGGMSIFANSPQIERK